MLATRGGPVHFCRLEAARSCWHDWTLVQAHGVLITIDAKHWGVGASGGGGGVDCCCTRVVGRVITARARTRYIVWHMLLNIERFYYYNMLLARARPSQR